MFHIFLDGKVREFSSQFYRHEIALQYAKKAVELMDEAYDHTLHTYTDPKEKRQFVQIVATAFHNAAVEYEFVEDYDACLDYYQRAFGVNIPLQLPLRDA